MPTATVGSAGADHLTLSAWWTAIKASATDVYTATLITDITDAVNLTGGTNAKSIVIQSDGTRRTITSSADDGIDINDVVITAATIQDINLNGASQAYSSGIRVRDMTAGSVTTLKRLIIYDQGQDGVEIVDTAQAFDVTMENCLIYDCVSQGVAETKRTSAIVLTMSNCGVARCDKGMALYNDANVTANVYNCWGMNCTTTDFASAANAVTTITYSVTSDTSATTGWDTSTGCAVSKTAYTDYFTNYAADNFHLKNQDHLLDWGISGNAATTPADDLDGVTRSTDDIGPYEYVAAAGGGAGSPISGPIGGPIGGPLGG